MTMRSAHMNWAPTMTDPAPISTYPVGSTLNAVHVLDPDPFPEDEPWLSLTAESLEDAGGFEVAARADDDVRRQRGPIQPPWNDDGSIRS